MRLPASVAVVCLLVAAVVLVWLSGRPIATDDLWWHLALGRAYAEHGLALAEDPLFHTAPGQPTVPHEWLFQVAVYGVQRVAGFQGLRLVHVLLVVAILIWSYRIFRRASGAVAPAALATTVLIALSWYRLFQFRPELLSVLALLGLYTLVLERDEPPGWGRVGAALALLVLWANAHSIFAVGPALLIAALLGVALRAGLARAASDPPGGSDPALLRRLAWVLGLGLLVTAANPRGFAQHLTFFTESASGDIWLLRDDFLPWNPFVPARDNRALTPFAWALADGLLLAFLLAAGTAGVRFVRERSAAALRALDVPHAALAAAGLVAMLVAARFHWMAFFPLLYLLRGFRLRGNEATRRRWTWACACAAVPLALVLPRAVDIESYRRELAVEPGGYWRTEWLDARYCGNAMRFLRDRDIEGRMFQPFNLGGFLGYWLAPRLRTFIDGRLDHVPSEVLDDYIEVRMAARRGRPVELGRLLDKWRINVFVGTTFPSVRYAGGSWADHVRRLVNWVPVYTTQTCAVALRRSEDDRANLERVAAWYEERKIPFSERDGPDMGVAIREHPRWAMRNGMIPPNFRKLARPGRIEDPEERAWTLNRLAETLWRIGAFRDSVEADRTLLALRPNSKLARWRLTDALLQLWQPQAALQAAAPLCQGDPGYRNIGTLCNLARARIRLAEEAQAPPSS